MTSGATFKDHFSTLSELYSRHRPTYPPALFEWLAGLCRRTEHAWDCATGNGQAALNLASHFRQVTATDASEQQIAAAPEHDRIVFRTAPAEDSGLKDATVDLITVGQALHWFERDQFFREARRVTLPGAVLAAWCYELCRVGADCDAVVEGLYEGILEGFWPEERALVERGYRDIVFPGTEIEAPSFDMDAEWSADDMLGYLRTWSACKRYELQHKQDPVAKIEVLLREAWGKGLRTVRWPLTMRVCRL